MTDTVRVPREPTEAMMKAVSVRTRHAAGVANIVAAYRAMLAASPQGEGSSADAQGWRDIATAPRDGTDILVCCGPDDDPMFGVASWQDDDNGGAWQMWWSGLEKHTWPEFWMPLPPVPTACVAPIKTSADTGELRERVKQIVSGLVNGFTDFTVAEREAFIDRKTDATNMVEPVEFWGCADGNGIDPRLVFADRADAANVAAGLGLTVQPLYTHPPQPDAKAKLDVVLKQCEW